MSEGNVFSKINSEYFQLTAAEKKVADYVNRHEQKVQYMSISELAEECGVAEATISRFCRRLAYKGYNAFKLAVAVATAHRTETNPLSNKVQVGDTVEELCRKAYAVDVDAVTETLELLDRSAILKAADLICAAGRVLCMGQGGSSLMAREAAHLFSTVRTGVTCVSDSHLQAIAATELTPADVILYFSYSGATNDLQDMLAVTATLGIKVILVTRFPKSPGAGRADVVLQCGSKEGPYQLGSVSARMAQLFLLDVLCGEVCRRDLAAATARREIVAKALAPKHI